MAKVLVCGANGFVGKRLIRRLLELGYEVYALCRSQGHKIFSEDMPHLHYIWGDLRDSEVSKNIPNDLDAAYYLVHSMTKIVRDLIKVESEVAEQFVRCIKNTNVKQIIYLGGIINDEKHLSPHLKSRLKVEEILKESSIPVTILRASIIIGTGSASFQIIRDLCEKLPFMIAPKWVNTKCQPIAINDVIFYLATVLLNKKCYNKTLDIGGPDVLTFKDLMLQYSEYRNLKRWIIDVPVLTPHLSSYWLLLITSVSYPLCYYLVNSMKISSVVQLDEIKNLIPHQCLTYKEALMLHE